MFANGAPSPFPQAASAPAEWAVWGGCMAVAALLAGWALANRNRPARDAAVGISLLTALALAAGATLYSLSKSRARQTEENRRAAEERERVAAPP